MHEEAKDYIEEQDFLKGVKKCRKPPSYATISVHLHGETRKVSAPFCRTEVLEIRYGLPTRVRVTLAVFNTLGQQVAILQNGEQEAGYHEVKFDGSGLASGVYIYRIEAGSFVQTRKLILLL